MTAIPQEQDLFPPPAPVSDDQRDLASLLGFLKLRTGWFSAAEISVIKGWDDRRIRHLASIAGGQIMSGQRGYIYTRHASPEEFTHFYNQMLSQAKKMITRIIATRKVFHSTP